MTHATPTHDVPAARAERVVLEAGCTTGLGGDAPVGRAAVALIRRLPAAA